MALFVVFGLTGFSALTLQVVWQRVMSLHAGVDLVSFTTVVAAFLAGIGLGSLAGGALADRLGPRRSVTAFASSNIAIGVFAWLSLWLFYDFYRAQAEQLSSTPAKFAFNFFLLLIPTTLMGLSTPLAARSIVADAHQAGALVGRLYAVNTLGAAAGAAVAGWYFLGTYGFVVTTRIAGTLNVIVAVVLLVVARSRTGMNVPMASCSPPPGNIVQSVDGSTDPDRSEGPNLEGEGARPVVFGGRVWPWYLVYCLTGAVALGLEVVFFRIIDTAMRSNSYSFAHVLSLYLLLFGAGTAIASRIVKRIRRPDLWFMWLQFAVGVSALVGLIILVKGIPHSPLADTAKGHFLGEGLAAGFSQVDGSARPELWLVLVGLPLLVMAAPVLCMGAAFPFVQSLVSDRIDTLGRHTGRLLFANVAGNVLGTLVVGFYLIDRLGTSRTYRVLGLTLLMPGAIAALGALRSTRRIVLVTGAVVVMGVVLVAVPSNQAIYAAMHGVDQNQIAISEDRTCVAGLRHAEDAAYNLTVNGSPQNDYPFDDFHLLIGLTPAVAHDNPNKAMALGLGVGATPYGLGLDQRVGDISTVEICGGELGLLQGLKDEGKPELRRLLENPRQQLHIGDGRDFLLRSGTQFDIVVIDTLRSHAAFSGSLYSVEFYELVSSRLAPEGLMAQWEASPRVANSITEVFPYVMEFRVWSYAGSRYLLASKNPISFDRDGAAKRVRESITADMSESERVQLTRLAEFYEKADIGCVADGGARPPLAEDALNHDLRPRDEYFLNNPEEAPRRVTCG